MILHFNIELSRTTSNLFLFIGEVSRLCHEKKNFVFGFSGGSKLYLETCNGLQKNAYICVKNKKKDFPLISALNYAMALHATANVSLHDKVISFEIESDEHIYDIKKFADSLCLEYSEEN